MQQSCIFNPLLYETNQLSRLEEVRKQVYFWETQKQLLILNVSLLCLLLFIPGCHYSLRYHYFFYFPCLNFCLVCLLPLFSPAHTLSTPILLSFHTAASVLSKIQIWSSESLAWDFPILFRIIIKIPYLTSKPQWVPPLLLYTL